MKKFKEGTSRQADYNVQSFKNEHVEEKLQEKSY